MTPEQLRDAQAAVEKSVDDTNKANQELLRVLQSLPGGEEMLRRQLAPFNLDPATFDRLLRGEVRPEDSAILAGFKIGQS